MAGVAMRMLVLTLLIFKKVKLIFGHPVPDDWQFRDKFHHNNTKAKKKKKKKKERGYTLTLDYT